VVEVTLNYGMFLVPPSGSVNMMVPSTVTVPLSSVVSLLPIRCSIIKAV